MKRDLYAGEYERVRRKAEMRRNVEFPDDDPENRDEASMEHVKRSHAEAVAILTAETEEDARRRAEASAKLGERRQAFNESLIRREYAAAGLEPPLPLVSLGLMKQMGWRVEEIDGKKVLTRPTR